MREILILSHMNHPNVITIYEYFESPKYFSVICNHVNGKPLMQSLAEFSHDYTTIRILKILNDVCRALRHLKAKEVIWCNFSHHNIIYDGNSAVICGFGPSRLKVSRDKKLSKEILGLRGKF